jgi:iron complex outermembrane receptor protein
VITRKPELGRAGGQAEASYGQTDRLELQGAVNLPLSANWALRLAGYALRSDGWIDNVFTPGVNDRLMGQNKKAGRASLRYRNGPLDLVLIAEHERRRLDGTPYRGSNADREVLDALDAALGTAVVIRGGPRAVDSDLVDPRDDGAITSLTARADLALGFATLTSITGYRRHHFFYSEDSDATPLPFATYRQWQSGDYASEELRLVSPSGGALTWSAGASAYREHVRARYANEADESFVCRAGYGYGDCGALTRDLFGTAFVPAPGGLLVDENAAWNVTTGLSAFGDVNYRPFARLQLGAGLRYSWDRKRLRLDIPPVASSLGNIWSFTFFTDGAIGAARTWTGFTPRLFVRYEPSKRLSLYASLTRGYKAGGFGTFTVEAPGPIPDYGLVPAGTRPDSFAPETVWSKEIGAKGALFDRRLSFDVAAFHYVYRNLQTNYYDTETRTQQVINIGRVHGYGVETALSLRPSRFLDLQGNLTWTRTVTSGDRGCSLSDCGGLPNPSWASSGVANLHLPFGEDEAFATGEWKYEGRRREAFDWRGIARRAAYASVNLRAGYRRGDRWEAAVYVQNLFDSLSYGGAMNGGDLSPANVWGASQPRNAGISLRYKFGS